MPYTFHPANDLQAIAEREYGEANSILFTAFDSCLGLIAREGATVRGVHLVMVAPDGSQFDNNAAVTAAGHLQTYTELAVIGHVSAWNNQLNGPYQHLLAQLGNPVFHDVANGTYGGRVDHGVFQLYMGDWVGA